jgi:hypothetical protein
MLKMLCTLEGRVSLAYYAVKSWILIKIRLHELGIENTLHRLTLIYYNLQGYQTTGRTRNCQVSATGSLKTAEKIPLNLFHLSLNMKGN